MFGRYPNISKPVSRASSANGKLIDRWTPFPNAAGGNKLFAGKGNHATRKGASTAGYPIWNWSRNGRPVLSFSGTDGWMEVDNSISNPLWGGMATLTVEAWVRPLVLSGTPEIVKKNTNFLLRFNGTGLQAAVWTAGLNISSGGTAVVGKWCHACLVYDGATLKAYLNGDVVFSIAVTGSIAASSTEPMTFGAQTGGGEYFTGQIDTIAIYSAPMSAAYLYQQGLKTNPDYLSVWQRRMFDTGGAAPNNIILSPLVARGVIVNPVVSTGDEIVLSPNIIRVVPVNPVVAAGSEVTLVPNAIRMIPVAPVIQVGDEITLSPLIGRIVPVAPQVGSTTNVTPSPVVARGVIPNPVVQTGQSVVLLPIQTWAHLNVESLLYTELKGFYELELSGSDSSVNLNDLTGGGTDQYGTGYNGLGLTGGRLTSLVMGTCKGTKASVSAWFTADDSGINGFGDALATVGFGNGSSFFWEVHALTTFGGLMYFQANSSAGSLTSTTQFALDGGNINVVLASDGVMGYLYVNGILEASGPFTIGNLDSTQFQIWATSGVGSSSPIDEVVVWNRMLTSQEAENIAAGADPLSQRFTGFTVSVGYNVTLAPVIARASIVNPVVSINTTLVFTPIVSQAVLIAPIVLAAIDVTVSLSPLVAQGVLAPVTAIVGPAPQYFGPVTAIAYVVPVVTAIARIEPLG